MTTHRRALTLPIFGVAAIALAAAVELVAVPALTRLPGDTDVKVMFAGTIQSFDPTTFQLGAAAPVTAERRVRVVATDGDTAVIESNLALHTPAGVSDDAHTFAINRTDYKQTSAPAKTSVEDQRGAMTLSRPADPSRSGFNVYDPVTQTAVPVAYAATRTLDGRHVYDFAGQTTAPVRNPKLVAQLEAGIAALAKTGDGTTLPKAMLQGLATKLPGEQAKALQSLLTTLPDLVPVVFTATDQFKLAIDTQFGSPVQTVQRRTFVANIDAGAQTVPLAALTRLDITQTPASVKERASFLSSSAGKLQVIKVWAPGVFALGGLLLIGLGLRARRRPAQTAPERSKELVTESV